MYYNHRRRKSRCLRHQSDLFYEQFVSEDVETVAAFSATSADDQTLSQGEVLQFDVTLGNLGGYYQADNGVFICPYSGTYVFSVSVLTTRGDFAAGALYIDGALHVIAWADDAESTHSHASNMVVAPCTAGGQVYVEAVDYGTSSFRQYHYTIFAGFLLQRYE